MNQRQNEVSFARVFASSTVGKIRCSKNVAHTSR